MVEQPDGSWRETKFRFAEFDDPYVKKGAGVQFYHSTSKDDRAQIWFSPYVPPPEVPDAEFDAVRKHFTEQEVLEISVIVGTYMMHNRVFTALRVDLEPAK